MKLRLMMGVCALAAATALGADVMGRNVCGLMNVPSGAKVTMISVPWVTVGGEADAMKVADLVKTDTLKPGDELYYYDGATYFSWKLQGTVLQGNVWTPAATTKEDAKGNPVTIQAPDASYALPRGKGLFLVRQDATKEIWLYGQHSTAQVSVAVAAGTAGTPAYTMIANPNAVDYDLNAKGVGGAAGDQILLGDGGTTLYTRTETAWTRKTDVTKTINGVDRTFKTDTTEGVVIPAGKGAWYVSKGGSPTIAW